MQHMKTLKLATLAVCSAIGQQALAADINFSGYGSIRGGMLTDDDYVPPFIKLDDEFDFEPESVFALQASTRINDKWSATVVMRAAGDEDFDVEARWAYVNYSWTPETTITLGRFALPFFRASDTNDIGYTHNFARMPSAIYSNFEFEIVEGVRLTHNTFVGDGDLTVKASFAQYDGDVRFGNSGTFAMEFNNIFQLSAEYTWEWLTLFAGGFTGTHEQPEFNQQIEMSVINTVNGIYDQTGLPGDYSLDNGMILNPLGNAVYDMDELYFEDDTSLYLSAGFAIDYNNFMISGEYANYGTDDTFLNDYTAYYATAGYRYNDWVFSIVHQSSEADDDISQANSATDPIVKGVVNAAVLGTGGSNNFEATGFHIRYDAFPGVAYKAEYTYFDNNTPDTNILAGQQNPGDSTGLFTFGVDFVF